MNATASIIYLQLTEEDAPVLTMTPTSEAMETLKKLVFATPAFDEISQDMKAEDPALEDDEVALILSYLGMNEHREELLAYDGTKPFIPETGCETFLLIAPAPQMGSFMDLWSGEIAPF